MMAERSKMAIAGLRWTLGLVVLAESLRLALAPEGHFFAAHPFLHHLRPVLAWSEAAAAALFLIPFTAIAGGWALIAIFAVAAILHVLHRGMDIGGLLIYAAAVLVI